MNCACLNPSRDLFQSWHPLMSVCLLTRRCCCRRLDYTFVGKTRSFGCRAGIMSTECVCVCEWRPVVCVLLSESLSLHCVCVQPCFSWQSQLEAPQHFIVSLLCALPPRPPSLHQPISCVSGPPLRLSPLITIEALDTATVFNLKSAIHRRRNFIFPAQ